MERTFKKIGTAKSFARQQSKLSSKEWYVITLLGGEGYKVTDSYKGIAAVGFVSEIFKGGRAFK